MTARRKKSGGGKLRWFLAICLALVAAVALTRQDDLPPALSENAGIAAVYGIKEKITARFRDAAPDITAKAKNDDAHAGYNTSDRTALDQLIEKKGI